MKTKITFAELQERVAASAGIPKKEARVLMKEMAAIVGNGLVEEGKVNLAGLGRFSRKVQSARKGRHPRTGEPIEIPEKNRVHYLPEAQLRRFINREFEDLPAAPIPAPQSPAGIEEVETGPEDPARASVSPAPSVAVEPHRTREAPLAAPPLEKQVPGQPAAAEEASPQKSRPIAGEEARADTAPATDTSRSGRRYAGLFLAAALVVVFLLLFLWPGTREPVRPPATPEQPKIAVTPPPQTAETAFPEPDPQPVTPVSEPLVAVTLPAVAAADATAPEPGAAKAFPSASYTVRSGDNLWKISETVYDYAYFWPVIFQANQTDLPHPDTLRIGMQLAIPPLEGRFGQLAESDLQLLADGYLQVYRAYQRHRNPQAPYYLWVAYRLRNHWLAENDLLPGESADLDYIRQLKGQGLIH